MNVRIVGSWPSRARGLLWGASPDDVLVLVPCRDVHTCFMRQPVDVAFVGSDGVVLAVERGLPP